VQLALARVPNRFVARRFFWLQVTLAHLCCAVGTLRSDVLFAGPLQMNVYGWFMLVLMVVLIGNAFLVQAAIGWMDRNDAWP